MDSGFGDLAEGGADVEKVKPTRGSSGGQVEAVG
jgi:hypothetical protein